MEDYSIIFEANLNMWFVFSNTIESPLNHIESIKEEIKKTSSTALIIFDLLAVVGFTDDRYYWYFMSDAICEGPEKHAYNERYIQASHRYYHYLLQNKKELGILNRAQIFLIRETTDPFILLKNRPPSISNEIIELKELQRTEIDLKKKKALLITKINTFIKEHKDLVTESDIQNLNDIKNTNS